MLPRCTLLALFVVATAAPGQNVTTAKRYEIEENLVKFPQQSPQQAMQSVVKLLNENRLDYLVAHLADPAYVDAKVEAYSKLFEGPPKAVELVAFNQLVKEIGEHFRLDPTLTEELRRYPKEGMWEVGKTKASARLPGIAARQVFFVEAKGRWYLQNQR